MNASILGSIKSRASEPPVGELSTDPTRYPLKIKDDEEDRPRTSKWCRWSMKLEGWTGQGLDPVIFGPLTPNDHETTLRRNANERPSRGAWFPINHNLPLIGPQLTCHCRHSHSQYHLKLNSIFTNRVYGSLRRSVRPRKNSKHSPVNLTCVSCSYPLSLI